MEQLIQEKDRLLGERALCRQEFIQSFNSTQSHAKETLLRGALSASVAGLLAITVKKITSSDNGQRLAEGPNLVLNSFFNLIPILLPLLQNILKKNEHIHVRRGL